MTLKWDRELVVSPQYWELVMITVEHVMTLKWDRELIVSPRQKYWELVIPTEIKNRSLPQSGIGTLP